VQERLIAAALKGDKAFREEWDRVFHPQPDSPGVSEPKK
jgi:hypothetical protein